MTDSSAALLQGRAYIRVTWQEFYHLDPESTRQNLKWKHFHSLKLKQPWL